MLLSIISVFVIDEGPYKTIHYSASTKHVSKEAGTDLKSETTINYNDEVDAVHPRLKSQGHSLNLQTTVLHEKEIDVVERRSFNHERNYNISHHQVVQCDEILLSSESPTGNLIDGDRELNLLEEKSNNGEVKNVLYIQIKEFGRKNPVVQMFTLIQWSLMRRPYFLITMIGSSYSFTALLNYFLLLPLLCKEVGLSENQTSILLSATNTSDVLFRIVFAWAGDWKCSKELFCGKPRRMLYAISVLGVGVLMIGILYIYIFAKKLW